MTQGNLTWPVTTVEDAVVTSVPRRERPDRRFRLALGGVVVVAAVLRLWSITFGVPLVQYPDEPNILNPALSMVVHHDLNPHWFVYPGLIIDIEVGVVVAVNTLSRIIGLSAGTIVSLEYVLGRSVMAGFGIASVWLVGALGYRLARHRHALAGLVAAGILAVSFLFARDAHYLKPDVPTAFFAALTLWFTLNAMERDHDHRRDWLLAGAAVGFASASKYTGLAVALVPASAMLTVPGGRRAWLWRRRTIAMTAAIALAIFLVFDPGAILTPRDFYRQAIVYNQHHYATGHPGAEGRDSWLWYLEMLWSSGIGPTLSPLVVIGVLYEAYRVTRRDRRALLLLIFPILYYLDSSRYVVRFDRQLMPILPYLALIGARWLDALPIPHLPRLPVVRVGLAAVALLAFTVPAVRVARWDIETGKTDTRYAALAWVKTVLPAGSVVAREWYTPPLADHDYRDLYIRSAYEQPVAWFDANRVQYLLVSSFMYQRYLDAPTRYPDQAAFYRELLQAPALARFDPAGRYTGPVIYVFEMSAVRSRLNTHSVRPPG